MSTESVVISLFEHYPLLRRKLPRAPLGEFPTPVRKLDVLGDVLGAGQLYIKRDDLFGKVYGGNKIRKLEFIVGRALESGAREVLTFGYPGYKHPLATAICAQQVGLKCTCMMLPDAGGDRARRNLLVELRCGAELHQHRKPLLFSKAAFVILRRLLRSGHLPWFISGSRSCPRGTVGYVNAAFELKDQVTRGEAPEPDLVYVPLGTMGTAVGLALGLKAAGMRSRVVAVRAASEMSPHPRKMAALYDRTVRLIRSADPSFPGFGLSRDDLDVRHGFAGVGNGLFDERAEEARSRIETSEGIKFDWLYARKALACLLDDAGKGRLKDKVVLFWNTYDSRDLSDIIAGVHYRELPRSFHRYFEGDADPK